jgi:hypothetical protein
MSSPSVAPAARVFLPSLAAELPGDWSGSEAATLTSPSGTVIEVRLEAAPEGWGPHDVIERQEAAARAVFPGLVVADEQSVTMGGGRTGIDRHYALDPDGRPVTGRLVSSVAHGLVLTVSATWPDGTPGADADVDRVLAGLRLLRRPVAEIERSADHEPAPSGDVGAPTGWSAEELAVCALILGSPVFPTVGSELMGAMPGPVLDATVDAIVHSLIARDVLTIEGDRVSVSAAHRRVLEPAVYPALSIAVERLGSSGREVLAYCVRPDVAVQVVAGRHGRRRCTELVPATVVDHLLAATCTPAGDTPARAHAMAQHAEPEALAARPDIAGVVVAISTWRDGEVINGSEVIWAIGCDGGLWLADAERQAGAACCFRAVGPAAIRHALLGALPGA